MSSKNLLTKASNLANIASVRWEGILCSLLEELSRIRIHVGGEGGILRTKIQSTPAF